MPSMRAVFKPRTAMHAFAPFAASATSLAVPAPLSFAFADSLPTQSWQPPSPAVLYELAPESSHSAGLGLETLESAWAATERQGL